MEGVGGVCGVQNGRYENCLSEKFCNHPLEANGQIISYKLHYGHSIAEVRIFVTDVFRRFSFEYQRLLCEKISVALGT